MERHHEELRAAGLQLIAVGLGKPEHAARYCGQLAPSQRCFAATSNDAYYAWGLQRGSIAKGLMNSIAILRKSAEAAAQGFRNEAATGDVAMMPGTFIVDRAGIVRYAYYGEYAGDDPEIAVLIDAAAALNGAGSQRTTERDFSLRSK